MSMQIAVRIPDQMIIEIDGLVDDGDYESRAELVRVALEGFLDADRRRRIGQQIVEGYTRIPQDPDEFADLQAMALRSLPDEDWEDW